jgi:la-related protein 1
LKVFLESVLLEMRAGRRQAAMATAEAALEIHCGTGRLWAVLVQLKHTEPLEDQSSEEEGGEGAAAGACEQQASSDAKHFHVRIRNNRDPMAIFCKALKEVPKSGEVWCEGARIHLNPLSTHFDLEAATRYLDFAIQFTPQYGDSFVEKLRVDMISDGLQAAVDAIEQDAGEAGADKVDEFVCNTKLVRRMLEQVDTSVLEQRCVNADPNYGSMWFHCKVLLIDCTVNRLYY